MNKLNKNQLIKKNQAKEKKSKLKFLIRGIFVIVLSVILALTIWLSLKKIDNKSHIHKTPLLIFCDKTKCESNLQNCLNCTGELECKECLFKNNKECFKCYNKTLNHFTCTSRNDALSNKFCVYKCKERSFGNGSCDSSLNCKCNESYPIQKCPNTHYWQVESRNCRIKTSITLNQHNGEILSLLNLPNNLLASASSDFSINIYNLSDFTLKTRLNEHEYIVTSLVLSDNGDLISGSHDRTVKVWDLISEKSLQTLEDLDSINSLVLLQNGDLASALSDSTVNIWNLKNFTVRQNLKGHTGYVFCLTTLPNGDLVSGSSDETIIIWDTKIGRIKKILKGNGYWIFSLLALSNNLIASGCSDGYIRIWDIKSGRVQQTLSNHTDSILALTLLNNGDLVSGSQDSRIKIWDLKTGELKNTLIGHKQAVKSLAVLPNGDLASGSEDKTIKIWNPDYKFD